MEKSYIGKPDGSDVSGRYRGLRSGVTPSKPVRREPLARKSRLRPVGTMLSRFERFDITNAAGDVFMRRYKLLRTPWGNLYLHEILRSDEDLCLHDHPWRFATLILAGGYREVLPGGLRHRPPGTFLFRPAKFRHRVECDRPAWSLVIVGRKVRRWGFFTRFGWRAFEPGQPRPICEDAPERAGGAS